MKKKWIIVYIFAILVFIKWPIISVLAVEDVTEPEFYSIEVDKKEATGGDEVKVSVEASDIESGIDTIQVVYKYQNTNDGGLVELHYNELTKKYEGIAPINGRRFNLNGNFLVYYILITDKDNNVLKVYNKGLQTYPSPYKTIISDLNNGNINVSGNDLIPPIFHIIKLDKKEAIAGEKIKISVQASDTESGVDYVTVRFLNMVNYKISQEIMLQFNESTKNYEGTLDIDEEVAGGRWIVDEMSIYDKNLNALYLNNQETQGSRPDTRNFSDGDFYINDKTPPRVTGVKSDIFYNEDVTPVFNEGTATLNGSTFISGKTISEEGQYYLVVTDKYKNVTTVNFTIDKTAPSVLGVTPERAYNKDMFPTFNEGTATLNGVDFPSETKVSNEGKYTLILTDKASNKTTVNFRIDKTPPIVSGATDNGIYKTNVTLMFDEDTAWLNTRWLNTTPVKSGVTVTEDGFYDLSVYDEADNITRVRFIIDREAPHIDGVSQNGFYKVDVTPVFYEGKATLNGTTYTSGETITKEGDYTLIVTDDVGNIVTINFIIDKTPPDIEGITPYGIYNMDLTPTFIEGEATLNGETFISGTKISMEGEYLLVLIDIPGNYRVTTFTIDKTTPTVPSVNEVTENSTSVSGTAEAGSSITLKAGTTVIGTATTTTEGKYSVTIPKQKTGTTLTVTAKDEAGNVSEVKEITVKDVTAPTVPTVNAVYDNAALITGKAESNAKVYAMVGSKKIGEATAKNGAYTITITKQKAGTTISVYAVDTAENKSTSKTVKVTDKTAPTVPTVNAVYDNATLITGKAESNAKVYAMVGSKKIGEATAKNGAYTITITKQKAGTTISVYAVDTAGNKSSSKIVKVIDKTAPTIPTVNAVYDNATLITGKAESNAKVYAMIGSKKIGEATAKNGAYTIKIAKRKAGTSISVYAVDVAGNKSSSKVVKVVDKTAPSVPTVNKITSKSVTVTGKSEKGASIYIYNGSKKIGQGIVDNQGNYKVKIKAQKKGSTLKIYAQDKSGNKSKSKAVKVS